MFFESLMLDQDPQLDDPASEWPWRLHLSHAVWNDLWPFVHSAASRNHRYPGKRYLEAFAKRVSRSKTSSGKQKGSGWPVRGKGTTLG